MKILKAISILTLAITTLSCTSVKVLTDPKKTPDFTKYETFSFISWQDLDEEMFDAGDKKLLEDAFVREYSRRGFKRVNTTGNMQVSVYVVTSDQTAYSGYNDYVGRAGAYNHYGGGYGYGYGYGGAYGGAYGGTYASRNNYKQRSKLKGTIIMNIYDGSKNQIWQIVSSSAVQKNPEKRVRTIPAKVETLMRRFPIQPKKEYRD